MLGSCVAQKPAWPTSLHAEGYLVAKAVQCMVTITWHASHVLPVNVFGMNE